MGRPPRRHQGQEAARWEGVGDSEQYECELEPLLWASREEQVSRGQQASSGLAGLDHFSRLWGRGAVPSCLVPGLGDRGTVTWSVIAQ